MRNASNATAIHFIQYVIMTTNILDDLSNKEHKNIEINEIKSILFVFCFDNTRACDSG